MKNADIWKPTKFVVRDGRLGADLSERYVASGSQIMAELMARAYEEAISKYASGRLLDLGCGQVPLYGVYRDRTTAVVCVDWPASLHAQDHLDFRADLTQPLDLPNASFETVILSDVLEHIPNPELLVSEIARLLSPGGTAIIGVPFLYWIHEEPFDYNRYTSFQLRRLMADAGLQIEEISALGGSPEVVADIVGKTLMIRPALSRLFVRCARRALNLKKIKRLSERTKDKFPLAYLVAARKPA